MVLYSFFYEIIKYTIAGIGVVLVAFYLLKPYLENKEKLQLIDLKKAASAQTLPLRLQAYERVILFIDRINPSNLLIRVNASAYTTAELQSLILNEVRNEFQHNVTQQLYISTKAWQVVKRVKDDTVKLTNNIAGTMPQEASGLDMGKAMLNHLSKMEHDPYDAALNIIKAEVELLF